MRSLFFLCLGLCALQATAQPAELRANLNPDLKPFYHGVASGDPLSDRVVLWTRIAPDVDGTYTVAWEVATEVDFTNVVSNGSFTTDSSRDYTVKPDAAGLSPDTWYYYRFIVDLGTGPDTSMVGRTRTLPTPGASLSEFRMAVASCQSYDAGYYGAWEGLANRNDVDLVLHLGDYIYEYGGSDGTFPNDPETEIVSLSDYRRRYALYRLDPDLAYVHQQFPFINVWDDHESTNNSWREGAQNHQPDTEGDWFDRLDNSIQAYYEWLPIRPVDTANTKRIYRSFEIGDLIDLHMLDTRIIGRDEQSSSSQYADTTRTLLGEEQFDWLVDELKTSTKKWQLLGQQVMMAQLVVPLGPSSIVLNGDQWDGYIHDRNRLFDTLITNNINNTVVLTGDIHTSWAADLARDPATYEDTVGGGSIAVEFVAHSITSGNEVVPANLQASLPGIIQSFLPYYKYVDLLEHGLFILDLDPTRAQADFYNIETLESRSAPLNFATGWFTNDGENHLRQAAAPSVRSAAIPALAPRPSNLFTTAREEAPAPALVGIYPNPFAAHLHLQYLAYAPSEVSFSLLDATGRVVFERATAALLGLNEIRLNLPELPGGVYTLRITTPQGVTARRLVRQ